MKKIDQNSYDQDDHSFISIEHFLPYRLNVLAKRISQSLAQIYTSEFGISIFEWRVLLWLKNRPKLTAKGICELAFMDKTQVSRTIKKLEIRRLIERQSDSKDQRNHPLCLTPEGLTLIDHIIPKAIAWEKSLIQHLSIKEYTDLLEVIEKLEASLKHKDNET